MAYKEFRTLRADEIELRTGQVIQAKGQQTLLLYKDARCDMAMLDEAVGPLNWKREHSRENANCIVSIWNPDISQWVSKEDTGTESKTDADKGLASDSFKRACFNWGIGRELYTAPFIAVDKDLNPRLLKVSAIEYNDKREITALIITDKYGKEVWRKGEPKGEPHPNIDAAKAKEKSPQARMLEEIEACKTAIELQGIQARLDKNTTMSDAVRKSWQDKICEQGNKIHATKTQDGWMDDADLSNY